MILKPKPFRKLRYGPHWSKTGLVGHWPMWEGEGNNRIFDLSGNDNKGVLTAGGATPPTWEAGQVGPAIESNAAGELLNFGTGLNEYFADGVFSISFWIRQTATGDNKVYLSQHLANQGWMFYQTGGNNLAFFVYDYATDFVWATPLALNKWEHVIGVSDGGFLYLYRNGVLEVSGTQGAGAYAAAATSMYGFYDGVFGGTGFSQLDNISVYDRPLSASEAMQLYTNQFIMFEREEMWPPATQGVAVVGNAGIMTTNAGFWGVTY